MDERVKDGKYVNVDLGQCLNSNSVSVEKYMYLQIFDFF